MGEGTGMAAYGRKGLGWNARVSFKAGPLVSRFLVSNINR